MATFNLSFAIVCGCAGFLLFGCFAPSGPDPFIAQLQELNARKTQAAADCSRQIETLISFFADHETTVERESKAAKACQNDSAKFPQPNHDRRTRRVPDILSWPPECIAHEQKAVHAISELTGGSEPDLSVCENSDRTGCTEAINNALALGTKLTQETEPCVQQKIAKPFTGICAIDFGQDCILALDEGALCMPNAPGLPACNNLVKIENDSKELATAYQENERTAALRSQARAARSQAAASWAQALAAQRTNQQQFMVSTPRQPPTFIQPFP